MSKINITKQNFNSLETNTLIEPNALIEPTDYLIEPTDYLIEDANSLIELTDSLIDPVDLLIDTIDSKKLYKSNYTIQFGCQTDIGGCSNHENQDESLILIIDDMHIFGIFDGHGSKNGKHVAICAKNSMKEYFEHYKFDPEMHQEYFNNLFEYTDNKLKDLLLIKHTKHLSQPQYEQGGSTCTILVIKNDKCYYAHVGDSYGLICGKQNDKYIYEELGENHSPTNIDEYKRVLKFDKPLLFQYDNINKSSNKKNIYTIKDDEISITNKGSYYKNVKDEFATIVSIPNNINTLSMTRALGDFIFKYHGLISTPFVMEFTLDSKFETMTINNNVLSIVLASDGVWDNWKNEKVAEFVMYDNCISELTNINGTQRITESFIERNNKFGKSNFGTQLDNAVAIVIYITLSNNQEIEKQTETLEQLKINEYIKQLELEQPCEQLDDIVEFIVPILDPNVEL